MSIGNHLTRVIAVILLSGCGDAAKGDSLPPYGGTIGITDPVDGREYTQVDDEDSITPGIQITVRAQVVGFGQMQQIRLRLLDDTYDVHWDYSAMYDGAEEVVFEGVTLWGGYEDVEATLAHYTLQAFSADDVIESPTVSVTVSGELMDGEVAGVWETLCSLCSDDVECDDGLACDGREVCAFSQYRGEFCCYTETLDCATDDPCQMGVCTEASGGCVIVPLDEDGDGHPPESCGYDDCDDLTYGIHPGAQELCDALDNDCDGAIDENAWVADDDPRDLSYWTHEPGSPVMVAGPVSLAVAWLTGDGDIGVGTVTPGAVPAVSVDEETLGGAVDGIAIATESGTTLFTIVASVPNPDSTVTLLGNSIASTGQLLADPWVEILVNPSSMLDLTAVEGQDGVVGLVWRSDPTGDYELYFLPLEDFGTPLYTPPDVVRVTDSVGFSGRPSIVALESSGFALAWEDAREGNTEIYFTMLDASGAAHIPPRRITTAPGSSEGVSLAASTGGSGFGLTWMDSRDGGYDLLFTCLDTDGGRDCPEVGLATDDLAWYPALAPDVHAGQFVLAYAAMSGSSFSPLVTIASTGESMAETIEQGTPLSAPSMSVHDLSVADVAGYRLVIWIESGTTGVNTLRFAQLSCADGS